jgi:hypothetical protein
VVTWRVPVAALVLVICFSAIGYAIFPRAPHRHEGVTIRLPDRSPSTATWVWPDGVPGWEPGQTIKGYNVAGLQPVEVEAAQLAAARDVLDAASVRVLQSLRPGPHEGVVAILAAHTLEQTPERTCLAAVAFDDPVRWVCPGPHNLSHRHVFAVAARVDWPGSNDPLYLAGVARGDVTRIMLGDQTVYERGKTWGEFDVVQSTKPGARMLVYGAEGLLETVELDVPVGQRRVLR